jgi:hypothetical protein
VADRKATVSLSSNAATGSEKSSRNGTKWIDIGFSP